ncbi:leucine-rich_repeat domain-containing protein [Hexamita inflata]|uniref:Leucine-rich repeat domain-containing protein n=1 Tax=Hexamita inflata TaxID=28002 RepID=A0AA86PFB0_9EUKA|nr:leucine-rich repeat domain-containing protein [Hexamita inflata]
MEKIQQKYYRNPHIRAPFIRGMTNDFQTQIAYDYFSYFQQYYISKNFNVDHSPLKFMTQLIKLNAGSTNIKNSALLKTLVNLKELDLSKNINCDISSLKYLVKLNHLNLSDTCILDISAWEPLIHLEDLNVANDFCANVFYVDITPQKNMKKLQAITSSNMQLQKTHMFNQLFNLKKLDCNLKDISALKNLTTLQNLGLCMNKYINITPLQYLIQLTDLHLSNCEILEISALSPLYNLKRLDITQNEIFDITVVKMQFTSLRFLNNRVIDLPPIKNIQTSTPTYTTINNNPRTKKKFYGNGY